MTEPRMACVGVVVHPTKTVDRSLVDLREWAARHGVRVVAREVDAARIPHGVDLLPEEAFLALVDAVISLGAALDRLVEKSFVVEPHCAIELEHEGTKVAAFNDVVLGADAPGGSVELDLEVEGTPSTRPGPGRTP